MSNRLILRTDLGKQALEPVSNSLTNMEKLPQVEVLLATCNGEKYLPDFLRSLASQRGVEIHLRASDDGSADQTIGILEQFKNDFTSFKITDGPRQGPAANFFSLMIKSEYDYVALADQDDIWEENHLIDSVNRLRLSQNPRAMTFSKVLETFDPIGSEGNVWPKIEVEPAFHEIFFENFARGCTFVMKKNLVHLVCKKRNDSIVMHDWWILLVAKSCGSVLFAPKVEVRYRLHSNNVIGRGPRFPLRMKSILRTLSSKKWAPKKQLEALYQEFADHMNNQSKNELTDLFEISDLVLRKRLARVLFTKKRYRKNLLSDVLIRIYLIFKSSEL